MTRTHLKIGANVDWLAVQCTEVRAGEVKTVSCSFLPGPLHQCIDVTSSSGKRYESSWKSFLSNDTTQRRRFLVLGDSTLVRRCPHPPVITAAEIVLMMGLLDHRHCSTDSLVDGDGYSTFRRPFVGFLIGRFASRV